MLFNRVGRVLGKKCCEAFDSHFEGGGAKLSQCDNPRRVGMCYVTRFIVTSILFKYYYSCLLPTFFSLPLAFNWSRLQPVSRSIFWAVYEKSSTSNVPEEHHRR